MFLNADQKILANILANRHGKVIDKLTYQDQTGFIPGKTLSQNIRNVFNILYNFKFDCKNLTIISLDAEKAFDQVEWTSPNTQKI